MSISSIHSIRPFPEVQNHSLDSELFEALKSQDNSKLSELLKQGANPNHILKLDDAAIGLIINATVNVEEIKASMEPSEFSILMTVLKEAFEEVFEKSGLSPLYFAGYVYNLDAMKLLIEHGADVHFKVKQDGVEFFPLQIDALEQGDSLAILEILHENGVAIEEMVSDEYASPLELLEAAKNENNIELVDFLERHGYHI